MNRIFLISMLFLSANVFSHQNNDVPELWSWFKDLKKSKEACEIQSAYTLQKLNVDNIVENKYGIYGNVKSNRVVVKCIEISKNESKLMVAVAGLNKDSVEIVRNQIINSIE